MNSTMTLVTCWHGHSTSCLLVWLLYAICQCSVEPDQLRRGRNADCWKLSQEAKKLVVNDIFATVTVFDCGGGVQVYHVTFEGIRNRQICICQFTVALMLP